MSEGAGLLKLFRYVQCRWLEIYTHEYYPVKSGQELRYRLCVQWEFIRRMPLKVHKYPRVAC